MSHENFEEAVKWNAGTQYSGAYDPYLGLMTQNNEYPIAGAHTVRNLNQSLQLKATR